MRRLVPKYERPKRPWDKERISREKKVLEQFGLRRKNEIWRAENVLRSFRRQARELIAEHNKENETILINKLNKLGLIEEGAVLEDILALNLEDFLNRRLQTVVKNMGLANTMRQSRQFIVHGHISVNGVRTRFPSYVVKKGDKITVHDSSSISKQMQENVTEE